jgi:hypothetical protein
MKPKTFLNPEHDGLRYNEQFIAGIKHEQRSIQDNDDDRFFFEECETRDFIHPLGTVYVFKQFGYVANGYTWYRFEMSDLEKINN